MQSQTNLMKPRELMEMMEPREPTELMDGVLDVYVECEVT